MHYYRSALNSKYGGKREIHGAGVDKSLREGRVWRRMAAA